PCRRDSAETSDSFFSFRQHARLQVYSLARSIRKRVQHARFALRAGRRRTACVVTKKWLTDVY
uniref:Uncharacterized protein n=1 Tax=Anopheles dirus TaxID=7168 RepID=A0A182NWM8_9DIPT